jgi:hypothetical protein
LNLSSTSVMVTGNQFDGLADGAVEARMSQLTNSSKKY